MSERRDSMPVTIQGLLVPSKGVRGEGGARDVWEWSLSGFPQINHFVQSPEDPTVKNTAPGRGNKGRRRTKGALGKVMGWERRQQREKQAGGQRAKRDKRILLGQNTENTICS